MKEKNVLVGFDESLGFAPSMNINLLNKILIKKETEISNYSKT